MTYEQIETFLTVITYGSISAAAKYLYVSQSTISARIQQLETELDVQLLIRQQFHLFILLFKVSDRTPGYTAEYPDAPLQ